ncbi:AfsR/SARP family transcriptional regulator [Actinoplanes derwentensis]|uniref:DNA-binding transcriptional activator of the SARP family n=1 Tax=Actinoplanes derwentensis TaxID=113562 RepID=A0A1H1X2L0_9ACTN|nr:BTAD domain-containing putative transcriptional regulator [Actinoplanes derwentensis]GID85742.1 SARP family transcriptional regulator [Actinoplanes derwentensis]SDT03432.1 DNA-binding transcriptional activator of the SARP family [Actinoplanes derwentensis]
MTAADAIRLQIMGPLRLWRGDIELDAGPHQQRCLLALLIAQEGRPIGMAALIDLMWGADPPASAVNVIHKYIGVLRRLLEPGLTPRAPGAYLTRHDNGYRFSAGPETLDLVAFRRLVVRAKDEQARGRLDAALDDYTRALRLCQGAAGANLAESAAASATFAGIDGEFYDAVVAAAGIAGRTGHPSRVLAPLRLAARIGRLHEPVHAALVDTLAAAGHQVEALDAYRIVRERLADELGIDPGRELQDAQQRVLTQGGAPPPADPGPPTAQGRSVPVVRPAQLPPDQPLFVGRSHEMTVLHDHLNAMRDGRRTSPMVVAVDGMGGVGKSTIVAHFAHQVAAGFTDGQLYLDLRGYEDEDGSVPAADALRTLLYALGLHGADVPDTFDALVGAYRSRTAGKRFLVLLDDARDAAQVRPLLPNSADSLVLITSRRPLVGLAVSDGASLHRAHLPDLQDARRLLTTRLAGLRDLGGGDAVLDEIIELCGRLPLALAVLAARLGVRPQLSMATVAAELRDGARRLAAFPEGRGVTGPRTAFSWSYRQLGPAAARLFRLLSQAPTAGITAEACVSLTGADPAGTRAALEELAEAALVNEQDSGCFTAHVLVRAYAEELFRTVDTEADQRAAVTRLLQYYLHSSFNAQVVFAPNRTPIRPDPALPGVLPEQPRTYQEAIAWFARHRAVLKETVGIAADLGYGIVPWQLAITMQQYFEWYGYFQDWDDVMWFALRATRGSGDVIGEAHVLRSLAGARWFFGANEESLALLAAALEVFVENGMLLEQALTHINVHAVNHSLGEHKRALESAETAVTLCRAAGNETSLMRSLDCKGRSLDRLGQHEEAARVLQQALGINLRVGRRHEEAMIRVSIAHNLVGLGRTDDAVAELRRAADAARSVGQGPYHFQAFRSLSELLITLGDEAGAREAFDRASEVLGSFQGGGPPHMRDQLDGLAKRLTGSG